ncbi:NAD(P)H-binding protein [Nocardioides caldifontis]|uniref:NAD(P)H-binding protein n=1 Tax=Nocardioides caldifontis TaxID=2588938 RepID=UPI00193A495E|nr:NAD(P)H-binding protein [Nocardioides caldifontis]
MTAAPAARQPRPRVLVAGASGFVGRRLCPALVEAGYDVVAMTRRPSSYVGVGRPVAGDVHDPASLPAALEGCDVAYYLVHSLASADFERLDAEAARAFGRAAAEAGVRRIVYLGGLGRDDDRLSPHLRSRREVERLLGEGGVPVTTLRAGIVIGHGGLSWEMTRQLVERLPLMVTPRWVSTRTQPIAVADVVRYLVGVLGEPATEGRAFEVGGEEVLRYSDMMRRVAAVEGRPLVLLPVPMLSPRLSSHWLSLITDVDTEAGRSLVDSMVNEVVVEDDALHRLLPFERRSFDDAVRDALRERHAGEERPRSLLQRLRGKLPMPLDHTVPVHHHEPDEVVRRRRRVVAATSVAGAALLAAGLSTRPGSRAFYATTLTVAGVWTAGGLVSGPLHLGWVESRDRTVRRPVAVPVLTGLGAFGFFYGAALVARQVPPLRTAISSVLRFAEEGDDRLVLATTLANGVAEEVFFRGAVYAAIDERHAVVGTTAVYVLATLPTRNPALVLAAGFMGGLWALQRRATGGLLAPALTHVTWSALMVRYLPPVFRATPATGRGRRRS